MIGVTLVRNESIDKALRRFKKKYEKTGILKEYRVRTAFQKPSVKRRAQRIKSARKQWLISKENSR